MPTLDGAQSWLDRAEEHLNELRALETMRLDYERERTTSGIKTHVETGSIAHYLAEGPPRTEDVDRARVLVGETIQALRRTLDYIVFQVAFLDSGSEQNDTQFPIDEHPETFWRRLKRSERGTRDHSCYLIGVDRKHAAVFERYQPYKGTQWTPLLQAISNRDKHRRLAIIIPSARVERGEVGQADESVQAGDDGFTYTLITKDGVYMKFPIRAFVTFEDGLPVVQTLEELKAEVASVLEEFKPCMEGQCSHSAPP
ncbi:MAG TPA: hypothetical protein VNL92_01630 [Dehalococcoidia bacterium]|nr:hypothetical protein [Dehalococcoidia bacterium]